MSRDAFALNFVKLFESPFTVFGRNKLDRLTVTINYRLV
jgi:hypothetical protein